LQVFFVYIQGGGERRDRRLTFDDRYRSAVNLEGGVVGLISADRYRSGLSSKRGRGWRLTFADGYRSAVNSKAGGRQTNFGRPL